ncbi:MAG: phosphoribosylamine--glycine ligase, partial [Actinomycetota bacterium]|nr:phosphoribosylamine--glycine ligase [Actinomycetota bacterium]
HPPLQWNSGAAVSVVLAAPGYPQAPRTGQVISGADGSAVRHAGTAFAADGRVVATGGRVLSVVGMGADLGTARASAYDAVRTVEFEGGQYRSDIALAAVEGRITVP